MSLSKTIALIFFGLALSIEAKPPNFIIIFTDDQGYQDLGCFGSPNIKTPRIDKMAKEGMKFTSFYAQTVCGPARASLLTGSYPMRTERAEHDDGLIPHPAMSLNEVTLPELLKPLGYQTGMAGKWDISGRRTRGAPTFRVKLGPHKQGFDTTFWAETSACKTIREGEKIVLKKPKRASLTKLFTDKAIAFIKTHKKDPFLYYLAHPMPHTPIDASPQFKGKSKGGLYGDVIEELDFHTGRLLDKVKELGLDDKTYIIFTSDNGPWWREGKNSGHAKPLRSAKTSSYEGGLRVPFIIRAPGKVPANTSSDLVTATIDLMPTLTKLAGAKAPQDRVIDGLDISEIFHRTQKELDRPFSFTNTSPSAPSDKATGNSTFRILQTTERRKGNFGNPTFPKTTVPTSKSSPSTTLQRTSAKQQMSPKTTPRSLQSLPSNSTSPKKTSVTTATSAKTPEDPNEIQNYPPHSPPDLRPPSRRREAQLRHHLHR